MGQCRQSCGMPLEKNPKGGGTEADGTLSAGYCLICCRDGAFVHQGVTDKKRRVGLWPTSDHLVLR